jgi:hypothetical protein
VVEHGCVAPPLAGRGLHDALVDSIAALQREELRALSAER